MAWIDLSIPLDDTTPVWPGDPPIRIERLHDMATGAVANLSVVSICAHSGTHIDAPLHFIKDGLAIDQVPLEVFTGRCRIVDCGDADWITADLMHTFHPQPGERLLFKTRNSEGWGRPVFNEEAVAFDPSGAAALRDAGVRLVGIDYLSAGNYRRWGAVVHQIILGAGIPILESLDLSGVGPGEYDLMCVPLLIPGAEGAPARALVRPVS